MLILELQEAHQTFSDQYLHLENPVHQVRAYQSPLAVCGPQRQRRQSPLFRRKTARHVTGDAAGVCLARESEDGSMPQTVVGGESQMRYKKEPATTKNT